MKRVEMVERVRIPDEKGNIRETIEVPVIADYDEETGEYFLTGESVRKIDRAKARYMGLILPSEIKELRLRLGRAQTEMCGLLGLGARTWTRWETGAERPNQSYGRVLRALYEGRQTLEALCVKAGACVRWESRGARACYSCDGIAKTMVRMLAKAESEVKNAERRNAYVQARGNAVAA